VSSPFHFGSAHQDGLIAMEPYNRIPLDTSERTNEFMQWLHDAYRQKISKPEFVQRVESHYPGHRYETNFIAQRLPG
jgi:hypothetical protein